MNYVNMVPRGTRWRNKIENVLYEITPRSELERHVHTILHNPAYPPVLILKSLHVGAYGDYPHFNIKTDYSGTIHVYVYKNEFGDLGYWGMTE